MAALGVELKSGKIIDATFVPVPLQRDEATGGKEVWADSAYRSNEQEQNLKASQHESQIHERGYGNQPLTDGQKLSNTGELRVRARVEHVFGAMENVQYWCGACQGGGGLDEPDIQPQAH